MKKIINTALLLLSFMLFTKNSNAQSNFNDLNLYWITAKTLILQNNLLKVPVDQNTIDLLDRIVPKISANGIPGGVNEVAAILFERKNIKFLDPNIINQMNIKCNSLKQYIQNKDVVNIGMQVYDLGTFVVNFINTAYPQECETNNTGKLVLINTANNPYDVYVNDNFLVRVQGKSQSEKLVLQAGDNLKINAKEATKFFPKDKMFTINVKTCTTNNRWSIPN